MGGDEARWPLASTSQRGRAMVSLVCPGAFALSPIPPLPPTLSLVTRHRFPAWRVHDCEAALHFEVHVPCTRRRLILGVGRAGAHLHVSGDRCEPPTCVGVPASV